MKAIETIETHPLLRVLATVAAAGALALGGFARAAAPGITAATMKGSTATFNLQAAPSYITQPDGMQIYSWGYGCTAATAAGAAAGAQGVSFAPAAFNGGIGYCPQMQIPGPTLIVYEGQTVTVTLTNNLPSGAGNTSILFSGFQVAATGGVPGLTVQEAQPGGTVTYTFTPTAPGTHSYYSGTQPDLQVEMGLYGAVIVLPTYPAANTAPNGTVNPSNMPPACTATNGGAGGSTDDFRLAPSAFDHPATCYDREYLFQWAELDPVIHSQVEAQVNAIKACTPSAGVVCPTVLNVVTEPYHPRYFMINGRSMPDNMDANYAPNYPNQPYNANPHMHPGELTLVRALGTGRWQHPFHEHGNHVRILARDGNLILAQTDASGKPCPSASSATPMIGLTPSCPLAGRMEFDTDTTPGQTLEGIFYWTARGLNWDIFGHTPASASANILSLTQSGTTVTAVASAPIPLTPGLASISGVSCPTLPSGPDPCAGYNGKVTILSASTCGQNVQTCFTFTAGSAGLPAFTSDPTFSGSVNVGVVTPGPVFVDARVTQASSAAPADSEQNPPCQADANGYYTVSSGAIKPTYSADGAAWSMTGGSKNYYEWCADHNHPLEANPLGPVGGGGPATLPDPLIMTNGLWFNGTPYLGPDATTRSRGPTPLPVGSAVQNPPAESGIAFMWHSHNEREITTNDVFPGGMLMMMLVDPYVWYIDETL